MQILSTRAEPLKISLLTTLKIVKIETYSDPKPWQFEPTKKTLYVI